MSDASFPIIDLVDVIDSPLAEQVRSLLARILPLDLRDDRLDGWPLADGSLDGAKVAAGAGATVALSAAVAHKDNRVAAFVGGPIEGGVAELDVLVDPDVDDPVSLVANLIKALGPRLGAKGATTVQFWARPRFSWHDDLQHRLGATPSRGLHQMRAPLPVATEPIDSRPYRAHDDLDALRHVNNRAFSHHPDQGSQTNERLLATMAEPWFTPEGLRIHERDGRVAGFCWTKIHPSRSDPREPGAESTPLGEIYVIGVDPDFHGQGLGGPMTAAGLSWLLEQGLTTGMLYVEADNIPAIKTYQRLGFEIVRTDAAWTLPLSPS